MSSIAEIYYFEFKDEGPQMSMEYKSNASNLKSKFKEKVLDTLKKDGGHQYIYENQIVDAMYFDDEYIFGVIAKSTHLINNYLQRVKDVSGKIVDPNGLHIEDLRFFCIDLNNFYISLIKNYRVEHFKRAMIAFMNSFNEFESSISDCIPVIDEDIIYKASKFQEVKSFDFKIKEDSNYISNSITLEEEFGISQESIKDAHIKVTLSLNKPSGKIFSLLANKMKITSNFDKFSLTGTDESGEEVYLEFVNSFLTKKLPIDLNDEEFKNNENYFDEIKDKLIASLK